MEKYETKNLTIYNLDVDDFFKKIPDKSVDLIFADPPYFLSGNNFKFKRYSTKDVESFKADWDIGGSVEENFKFHNNWIMQCSRVLKDNGTIWISGTHHSICSCGYILQLNNWFILNDICWFKPNACPNLSCRMFTASHEMLLWAKKTKKAKHLFNYQLSRNYKDDYDFIKKDNKQMRSVWAITPPKPIEKQNTKHPTQKPEALLERIILLSSNENAVILDPFMGSGTTAIVSLKHNRNFIGNDNNELYLNTIAIPRIKKHIENEKNS